MSLRSAPAVGIDFGTSNSAVAAALPDGSIRPLPIEDAHTTLPTALFFRDEDQATFFGRAAMQQYLAGEEGRLMRSLKSLLGSSLIDERTAVLGEAVPFRDILTRFLSELATRAEAQLGARPRRAVMGRPVHFVDEDETRDAAAEAALADCARSAGFEEVRFELEPIAAAFDYERRVTKETRVMVVDIGGGTSDFTLVRLGPDRVAQTDRRSDILATTGVHIGGTDYDRALNLARVMPLLGLGHKGGTGREVPSTVFFELATWHLIHRTATPAALRAVRELRFSYSDRQLHERLTRIVEGRHGHRLAHAVEAAKITASSGGHAAAIDLGEAESGLFATIEPPELALDLHSLLNRVAACALECARVSGTMPDALYLTGGSSALKPFQDVLRHTFPDVALVEGDLFGGVAAGLAVASRAF
ncbi:Hsp70 family protein [Xylophilus rhododendri]|uniref:Hsp70 family protein n=1 Tax=Xylophilus rhododendri TaxID=2697032 RepID=A0A857JA28_9BURK|nr:Hsp70 family protein [Xylophilus rhododendri]QHJ00845.1 Hsp70 family protein [Xylophilus rhododendri]